MSSGKPVTAPIDHSDGGHLRPWRPGAADHHTGRKEPPDYGIHAAIEALFRLPTPYPAIVWSPTIRAGCTRTVWWQTSASIQIATGQLLLVRSDVRLRVVGRLGGPRARNCDGVGSAVLRPPFCTRSSAIRDAHVLHFFALTDESWIRADQLVAEVLVVAFAVVMHGELGAARRTEPSPTGSPAPGTIH
jgi:hypothetical protein